MFQALLSLEGSDVPQYRLSLKSKSATKKAAYTKSVKCIVQYEDQGHLTFNIVISPLCALGQSRACYVCEREKNDDFFVY